MEKGGSAELAHKIRKCWEDGLQNSISDFAKFFLSLGFHLQSWVFLVLLLKHQASMLSLFWWSQALRVKKHLPPPQKKNQNQKRQLKKKIIASSLSTPYNIVKWQLFLY